MTAPRLFALLAASALFVGCTSNDSSTDETPPAKKATPAVAASKPAAPPEYIEVPVGEKLYVVSSKEAAAKAATGKLDKAVRAFGYGKPGQKVYFEDTNQKWLETEYTKRHP